MVEEKKIRANDVAEKLGISIAKLTSWQKRGVLPPAPCVGKKRYYTEEYVEQAKQCLQKYLSAGEVKKILNIGDSILQKLVNIGLLNVEIRGGQRFFLREQVEQLKEKCPTSRAVKEMIREGTGHSISWLARELGISRQTLYTWLHRGLISIPQKDGKPFITSAYIEELKENLSQRLEQAHKIRTQVLRNKAKEK